MAQRSHSFCTSRKVAWHSDTASARIAKSHGTVTQLLHESKSHMAQSHSCTNCKVTWHSNTASARAAKSRVKSFITILETAVTSHDSHVTKGQCSGHILASELHLTADDITRKLPNTVHCQDLTEAKNFMKSQTHVPLPVITHNLTFLEPISSCKALSAHPSPTL